MARALHHRPDQREARRQAIPSPRRFQSLDSARLMSAAQPGRPDVSAIAALLVVQVLFGLHYLAAKTIVATIPPAPWSLIRAGAAGLALAALIFLRRQSLPSGKGTGLRFLGLGLIGVSINQYLFVEGIARTTPGHSALINTSIPVVVALIAVLLGRERARAGRFAGIGITLSGVLVLIAPGRMAWEAGTLSGDLLTVGNALSYSLFLVLAKPVFERERTLPASALLLLCGSLWLVPVGGPGLLALDRSAADPRTLLLAAFIVLGPTVGAYVLSTYALRRVESSLVAFFIYLQPVIGAGLSIALGFERPTLRLFIAAGIVFLGVFVALRARPSATVLLPAARRAPRG